MDDEKRGRIEERLQEERRRVIEALAEIDEQFANRLEQSDDGDITHYPFHLADEGTDTMEREKEALLATQEGRILAAIDDALRLLYKKPERFGICETCGKEISFERLDIVPWTRHCVSCKREAERTSPEEADVA